MAVNEPPSSDMDGGVPSDSVVVPERQTGAPATDTAPKRTSDLLGDTQEIQVQQDQPKKKKKKSGGGGRSKKKRGSGFEEYFCDTPITPEEYTQERRIYNPANCLSDRIEECIQRFRARRRLSSEQENLFSKYLMLGGIDSTTRQFQGTRDVIASAEVEECTNAELRDIAANDVIHRGASGSNPRFYNPNEPKHWVVDFAGVVSGFISERLFQLAGAESHLLVVGTKVVLNFLKYVEAHDVCPEYADDIKQAQGICNLALEEMPNVLGLHAQLPGDFNRAARELFGSAADNDACFQFQDICQPMDKKLAKAVFYATLLTWTAPDTCSKMMKSEICVVNVFEEVFEVLPLDPRWLPNDKTIARYKQIRGENGKLGTISPTGSIFMKRSKIEDGWDVAEVEGDEESQKEEAGAAGHESWSHFFLEEELIKRLKPGMKLRLVVCELNIDLLYIQEVKAVYPSFYVFLPQELMLNYKEPIANERPAPTADEPDAQDDELEVD